MVSPYVIILIEMRSTYSGLKENQGTVIANGSLRSKQIWN